MKEFFNDQFLTTSLTTTKSVYSLTSTLMTYNSTFNKTAQVLATNEDYLSLSVNSTSGSSADPPYRYWAFILILFPILCILGNVLVVISVFIDKNLQSCTNFFVVSLALSDLLIAAAVMPFAVYYEVNIFFKLNLLSITVKP